MLQHLDEGCAVLELLQHQVVDAACDDPAALILPHLVMPLIRDRLETKALVPKVWLALLTMEVQAHIHSASMQCCRAHVKSLQVLAIQVLQMQCRREWFASLQA